MTESEQRLLEILRARSFKRGRFKLASGGWSDHYIDGKMSEVFSGAVRLIGEVLYERTQALPLDALGGLEVGAVPLTTAAVMAYDLHGRVMEGFWVRDKVKGHGTQKLIEGKLERGFRVLILDDVITRGGSSLKAVLAAREAGAEVVGVLALVDRLAGAEQLLRSHGVPDFRAVFTLRDFGVEPPGEVAATVPDAAG
jgi:orotate phosphoribosyltransferase